MKIAVLMFLFSGQAWGAGVGCQDTSPVMLEKIASGATGTQPFGCINRTFDRIVASFTYSGAASTAVHAQLWVASITALTTNITFTSTTYHKSDVIGLSSGTFSGVFGDGQSLRRVSVSTLGPSGVDLSTVTIALNLKLTSGAIPSNFVDLSTVTARFSVLEPFVSTGTSKLVLSGGNVGIGTTSPGTLLHIASGTVTINGTGAGLAVAGSTLAVFDTGLVSIASARGGASLRIGRGGKSPTDLALVNQYLQIGGDEEGVGVYYGIGMGYTGTASYSPAHIGYIETVGTGNTTGDIVMHTRAVTTDTTPLERLRINKTGHVGIGTTSPGTINGTDLSGNIPFLHVKGANGRLGLTGTGDSGIYFEDSGGAVDNKVVVVNFNSPGFQIYGENDAFNVEKIFFYGDTSTGKVGIGNTAPNEALTVTGSIYAGSVKSTGPVVATTYYGDGSNLTGLPGGGDVTTTGNNTMTGYNVFRSSTIHRAAIEYGNNSGTGVRSPTVVWAKSIDGATQSSGCVVVLKMEANNDDSALVFTSTVTTNDVSGGIAVLFDDSCAAGAYCRVAIGGLVRVQCIAGVVSGNTMATYSTRCNTNGVTVIDYSASSKILAGSSTGWCTAMMGGH